MTQIAYPLDPVRRAVTSATGLQSGVRFLLLSGIFFSPYTTWRVVPGILFTISDAFFTLAIVLLAVRRQLNLHFLNDLTPLWLGSLALLILGLLVGSVVNGDPERWLIIAAQYVFAYGVLPIAVTAGDRRFAQDAAVWLLAGVTAMEAFGIGVYIVLGGDYDSAQMFGPEFITGAHRLGGFMADANWNGGISAMAIPLALYLRAVHKLSGWLTFPALLILGGGVILSGSFTGFSSAAAAVFIFVMLGRDRHTLYALLGLALIATTALASGVALPTAFRNRVSGALETGNIDQAGTYVGRMELMKEAWDVVDRTPLIGIGADQFRATTPDQAPVHNMYLLVWAEGGIMSLVGWTMLIMSSVVAVARAYASRPLEAAMGASITAVFFIFSIAAPHMYARSWVVPLLVAFASLKPATRRRPEY